MAWAPGLAPHGVPRSSWTLFSGGPLLLVQRVAGLGPGSPWQYDGCARVVRHQQQQHHWGLVGSELGRMDPSLGRGTATRTVPPMADRGQQGRDWIRKEHEIGVINYQLSSFNAELIKKVKGFFLHLPCHKKGFAASFRFTVFGGELKMEMERIYQGSRRWMIFFTWYISSFSHSLHIIATCCLGEVG